MDQSPREGPAEPCLFIRRLRLVEDLDGRGDRMNACPGENVKGFAPFAGGGTGEASRNF